MLFEGLIGVAAATSGLAVGLGWQCRGIGRPIASVHALVEDLQRAHDQHRAELDRRLASLEAGLARTENEARMVSCQLAGRPERSAGG